MSDLEKVKKLEAKAEAATAGILSKILNDSARVYYVNVPGYGKLPMLKLNMAEFMEIQARDYEDPTELFIATTLKMIEKANPQYTEKELQNSLSYDALMLIANEATKTIPFLAKNISASPPAQS